MANDTIIVSSSAANEISRDLSSLRQTVQSELKDLNSSCISVTEGAAAEALIQMVQAATLVGEALARCISETEAWLQQSVAQYNASDSAAATGFSGAGAGASFQLNNKEEG